MQINEKNLIFQKNTGLLLNLPSANFHFWSYFQESWLNLSGGLGLCRTAGW